MNYPYYYYYNIYIYNIIQLVCLLLITSPTYSQYQNEIKQANQYYINGDKEKALLIYEEIMKGADIPKTSQIHNSYFNLLLDINKYDIAEQYLKKIIKKEKNRISYKLDLGFLFTKSGEYNKATKIFKSTINKNLKNEYNILIILNYFISHRLFEYAINTVQEVRKIKKDSTIYALEMGNLYSVKNNKKLMIREYINYLAQEKTRNVDYIKKKFQRYLGEKEDFEILVNNLYDKLQKHPESERYLNLLIWANVQQHNFYSAGIKAKAYDLRFKKRKSKTLEVAKIALSNRDFDNAYKCFTYVIEKSTDKEETITSQLGILNISKIKLTQNQIINKDSLSILIKEYQSLIDTYPNHSKVHESILDQVWLYAYKLDEKEQATKQLKKLIQNPKVSTRTKAKAKMELATLYMIKKEPWESILLYAQVERELSGTPIGDEAKLHHAKLYYYKGDFELAQEHLDILKEATTTKTANDAMELSIRIKENTQEDTMRARLKEYATIELLLEEQKNDKALEQIEELKKKCYSNTYSANLGKEILDDVYWLEANIRIKRNEWNKAYNILQQIVTHFEDDVLADDALFLQGKIVEKYEHNKSKAMSIYLTFIKKFPGSVYVDEARKRYRKISTDNSVKRSQ